MRSVRSAVPLALALALVLGACGSGSDEAETDTTTTSGASSTTAMDHSHGAMDHGDGAMDHGDGAMDHGDGAMDHGEADAKGASASDKGLGMLHNGHHAEMKFTELTADERKQVDELLAASKSVAEQYPTLGVAKAAGFKPAGPFTPGLGIHYTAPWGAKGLNPDGVMDVEDMTHPMIVIFDGTDDAAKFAGFMYYSIAEKQPEGFPGDNDYWHYHTNVCTVFTKDGTLAPLGADRSATKEQCDKFGGVLMPKTQWMVHVWSIPGYEVSEADGGVFAEVNPKITCPDGTYYVMEEKDWAAHPDNVCLSEL